MVLLTSSQVSVAISSCIVILCTTALFLSGYAIQQRTLRDLRRAIRPDPRPSPKIFLPDRFKQSTTELPDGTVVNLNEQEASSGNAGQGKKGDITIEVRPSVPEAAVGEAQKPLANEQEATIGNEQKKPDSNTEAKESPDVKHDAAAAAKQPDKPKEEEPLSRAERRRRIKEEIMELSQGETPIYYQRRLW